MNSYEQNYKFFKEHINQWKEFLDTSIDNLNCYMFDDYDENKGESIKKNRQMQILINILNGAVANPNLLIDFINPESIEPAKKIKLTDSMLLQKGLDVAQKMAIEKALSTNSVCFIQGPPGTGKTTVITEICLQLLRINPRMKILVCSETHVAVDNLIEKFYKLMRNKICKNIDTLRILGKNKNGNDALIDSSIESHIKRYINKLYKSNIGDDLVKEIGDVLTGDIDNFGNNRHHLNKLNKEFMMNADIVGVTCNSLAALDLKVNDTFDYVIFDEVCKATLPEILIPLTIAKRAILVGDPKQLPPVFLQEDTEVLDTIDNCQLQSYMYIDNLFDRLPNSHKHFLSNQYRMTNEIGNIISRYFYDSKLKNGRNVSIKDSIVWCDYKPTNNWGMGSDSPSNADEVQIVKQILKDENKKGIKHNIAIITPYRGQKYLLKKSISIDNYKNLDIDIDTIDSFQGKDADIVIFNVTRSTGSLRFFSNPRRLNVALSRAKDMCYIIGYSKFAKKNDTLKNIYDSITKFMY